MSRRFVAVGVPPHVRGPLVCALKPLHRERDDLVWTDPDGWHVTLAFLGESAHERLPSVRAAVEQGVQEASVGDGVNLRVGAPARYGDKTLYLEVVEPAAALVRLGDAIQRQLAQDGLPVHHRPVDAHLTVARARRNSAVDDTLVKQTADAVATYTSTRSFRAEQLAIWSAQPRRDGGPSRYVVDEVVALRPNTQTTPR